MLEETEPPISGVPLITATTQSSEDVLNVVNRKKHQRFFNKERFKTLIFHLALIVFCCLYVVVGALIFYVLERPIEDAFRDEVQQILDTESDILLEHLLQLAENKAENLNRSTFDEFVINSLDRYEKTIFEQFDHPIKENFFKSLAFNNGEYIDMWTIPNAILFTSTTIIPVGFGYVTPMSAAGRFFLLVYSIVGLPLALMTLSDVGKFLCALLFKCFNNSLHWTMAALTLLIILYPIMGALAIMKYSEMEIVDSFYYSVSTMFTIGFGDCKPSVPFIYLILFIAFGVTLVTISIEVLATGVIHQVHYMGRQMSKAKLLAGKMVQMAQNMRLDGVLSMSIPQLSLFSRMWVGYAAEGPAAIVNDKYSSARVISEKEARIRKSMAYEPHIELDFVDF
ncbi:ion channel domain-containing protein [Ditylenchus destructor]|nr:ion channel domain-containing protein [Ditylenchus destructor]